MEDLKHEQTKLDRFVGNTSKKIEELRRNAENLLKGVSKLKSFSPNLLQLLTHNDPEVHKKPSQEQNIQLKITKQTSCHNKGVGRVNLLTRLRKNTSVMISVLDIQEEENGAKKTRIPNKHRKSLSFGAKRDLKSTEFLNCNLISSQSLSKPTGFSKNSIRSSNKLSVVSSLYRESDGMLPSIKSNTNESETNSSISSHLQVNSDPTVDHLTVGSNRNPKSSSEIDGPKDYSSFVNRTGLLSIVPNIQNNPDFEQFLKSLGSLKEIPQLKHPRKQISRKKTDNFEKFAESRGKLHMSRTVNPEVLNVRSVLNPSNTFSSSKNARRSPFLKSNHPDSLTAPNRIQVHNEDQVNLTHQDTRNLDTFEQHPSHNPDNLSAPRLPLLVKGRSANDHNIHVTSSQTRTPTNPPKENKTKSKPRPKLKKKSTLQQVKELFKESAESNSDSSLHPSKGYSGVLRSQNTFTVKQNIKIRKNMMTLHDECLDPKNANRPRGLLEIMKARPAVWRAPLSDRAVKIMVADFDDIECEKLMVILIGIFDERLGERIVRFKAIKQLLSPVMKGIPFMQICCKYIGFWIRDSHTRYV